MRLRMLHTDNTPVIVRVEHVVAVTVQGPDVVVVLLGGNLVSMSAEDRSRIVANGTHVNPAADLEAVCRYLFDPEHPTR